MSALDEIGPHPLPPDIIPSVGLNRDLVGLGWAAWHQTKQRAGGVEIVVDGRVFPAFYGLERIDIANNFGVREYRYTGFRVSIPARDIGRGKHVLTVRVISPDRKCYQQGDAKAVIVE